MSLADEFERRLEKIVEGVFSKAFKSDVEPSEIGRRLVREMEGGKSVSVAAVYVPNSYVISLSPPDHTRLEGLLPSLKTEFAGLLKETATQRRWRPAGPLKISFIQDEAVGLGKFEVKAAHEPATEAEQSQTPPPVLINLGASPPQQWALSAPVSNLGRSSTCEIVLSDANASRTHAQIEKRSADYWIEDLGSTNGTLVNGSLIKERKLVHGDRVVIGNTELEYRESS